MEAFISRSLLAAVDVNLVSFMDLKIIGCVQAAKIMMRQQAAIVDRKTRRNPDEADIELFAKTCISGVEIGVLNEFLLPRNE